MEGSEPWVNKGNNCQGREQAESLLLLALPSITLMDSIQALIMNKAWSRVKHEETKREEFTQAHLSTTKAAGTVRTQTHVCLVMKFTLLAPLSSVNITRRKRICL